MSTTTEYHLTACQKQLRPRLNTLLKLMFGEALALGHPAQWLGSVIELMQAFGCTERAVRTALFRLGEHHEVAVERHGRRSLCMLTPAASASLRAARQRLDAPPARSFRENWTMLVNIGGLGAAAYAEARRRLQAIDYCQLAPNVLARPGAWRDIGAVAAPHAQPQPPSPPEEYGMARFDVGGAQLAAVTRQPLFGQVDQDLEAVAAQYRQFQARFLPLCRLLDQPDAISDEQAFRIRLLVSDAYQHCRRADPLLPQELLPDGWQSMHAFRTYRALYGGCASPARRHFLRIMSAAAPDTRLSA